MTSKIQIKICGITTPEALDAAVDGGADYIGLVFWPGSVRYITCDSAASLSERARSRIKRVGLFIDPSDDLLRDTLQRTGLDMIQLHGREEQRRVQEIRARFGLPVIKAVRIGGAADLRHQAVTAPAADMLLFDADVKGMMGGTGVAFDWDLLKAFRASVPWMLSGGLTPENIRAALDTARPDAVDVSSGVEDSPGVKSPARIRAFIDAARKSA